MKTIFENNGGSYSQQGLSEMLYLKQSLKKPYQNLRILSVVTTVHSFILSPKRKVQNLYVVRNLCELKLKVQSKEYPIWTSYSQEFMRIIFSVNYPMSVIPVWQMNTKLSKSDLYRRLRKMKNLLLNFKNRLSI